MRDLSHERLSMRRVSAGVSIAIAALLAGALTGHAHHSFAAHYDVDQEVTVRVQVVPLPQALAVQLASSAGVLP